MWDPYAEFQSATLPNGLTVHAAHWPGRPWETMGFLIHSGAEQDPLGLEGLAHFVEHVVSENTTVSLKDMRATFKDCGGSVSLGMTGHPYTRYRFMVPTDKATLKRALSIFGHMLLSAELTQSIQRERQVIISEFHRKFPFKFQFDLATREIKALYAGYWLERFVQPLGNPESVNRITQSHLQSYYDTHYTPANMSIVAVGGMQMSEIMELLSESPFAVRKEGVRTPLAVPVIEVAKPVETRYVFNLSKHMTAPPKVGAYNSVATIPGTINESVIRILGEMLNDELNEEVRERRAWAYAIGSSRYNHRHFHRFSIHSRGLALKALDEIEAVIDACIVSMAERNDLFEQVKRRTLARNFMFDATGQGICNNSLDDLANSQRIISLQEIAGDLERVTIDDIRATLGWLRPEQRWTLISRP
jgi:zinc protease